MASGQGAEVAPAGPGRKGEEQGEHAAARLRAGPFNPAKSNRLGSSVVADILVVLEDEGEEARGWRWRGARGSRRHPVCRQLP